MGDQLVYSVRFLHSMPVPPNCPAWNHRARAVGSHCDCALQPDFQIQRHLPPATWPASTSPPINEAVSRLLSLSDVMPHCAHTQYDSIPWGLYHRPSCRTCYVVLSFSTKNCLTLNKCFSTQFYTITSTALQIILNYLSVALGLERFKFFSRLYTKIFFLRWFF